MVQLKKDLHEQEHGRTPEQSQPSRNPIARAAQSVGRVLRRAKNRLRHQETGMQVETVRETAPKTARSPRRETDIPMDEIARTYTPMQTSLKASFRSDGRDQQSDQEYANGTDDNRWSAEDRYTNRSGDPRIGTHRRTYEAAEKNRSEDE